MRRIYISGPEGWVLIGFFIVINVVWVGLHFYDRCTDVEHFNGVESVIRVQYQEEKAKEQRLIAAQRCPFDPNTADSLTLLRQGLSSRQVHNMLAYRRKGGWWRDEVHFAHLYGLNEELYQLLRPYLRFSPSPRQLAWQARKAQMDANHQAWVDSVSARVEASKAASPPKLAEGTRIDANTADTLLLQQIPGIGRWRANRIVRYRERLGGFVSVRQLSEVEDLPEHIERWFTITKSDTIRRLYVNKADFKTLLRHPYLNYEQVCEIKDFQRMFGPIRSFKDMSLFSTFSQEDFRRLSPYVSFDVK